MKTLMTNRPERVELSGWEFARSGLDKCLTPADSKNLEWQPATVPGTVAAELLRGQSINYDSVLPLDDDDFWYRSKFVLPADMQGSVQLHLEGLATFAEVWLDDELVIRTDNMFCAHVLDVSKYVQETGVEHWLSIRFCGLTPFLEQKHPRAKWRTAFVQHRNLRFVRTSLVGHTPGIFPQIPVVGPWRPVYFELRQKPSLSVTRLNATVVENNGVIDVELLVRGSEGLEAGDRLSLSCGGCSTDLSIESTTEGLLIARGRLEIDKPELWWPHTHGTPHTYDISIDGTVGGQDVSHNHKGIGFRTIELKDPFAICVNGLEIFCRGACWRPLDFLSMNPDPGEMRRVLELAVDAGMNMLRITGETAYETEAFYDLCDELGIMLWQDFMFARLDYPVEDEIFLSSITTEATQLLRRLSIHPCLTMLCGNTEVAQTAAMMGLDKEKWSNKWFDQSLPSHPSARACFEKRASTVLLMLVPRAVRRKWSAVSLG
jgi:beta-mannosidase